MKTLEELQKQYASVPKEIKQLKRWVGFWKTEHTIANYDRPIPVKCPMNALTGRPASTTNPLSWSSFELALSGCVKYGFDGIGFMLGNGIFGVDLDNHGEMSQEVFDALANEFITSLNSYTERSQSGKGIHIICKGSKPTGACRKEGTGVEIYDTSRYFAMTGNVVNDMPIEDRTEEIKPLWDKYLKPQENPRTYTVHNPDGSVRFGNVLDDEVVSYRTVNFSDEELKEKIKNSKNADDFIRLYYRGDLSMHKGDHSAADIALCTILAFWTGRNQAQIDRMFRSSALMREKWDQKRSETNRHGVPLSAGTYGSQTIEYACYGQRDVYTPPKEKIVISTVQANNIVAQNNESEANIDDNGDPILKNIKKTFKTYALNDTGNAERFFDYFGELFLFNTDRNKYMYWNNKTWIVDNFNYAKKYADSLIAILNQEIASYEKSMEDVTDEAKLKRMEMILKAMCQNVTRLSNKAGKEAMLSELQHLHNMPVVNGDFDTQENLLNTLSGVVDLTNGEVMPYDKNLMLSMNTNCKVSYEEPKEWLKFLAGIYKRDNEQETKELIDFTQKWLGYALTGRKNKDKLIILHGEGSNGKSTFTQTVKNIFGDYGKTMNSALLVQNQNSSSQSTEFALSALLGARFVSTSETAEGKLLDETTIKQMTSGEEINAQFKYGAPFSFRPAFTPVMSTNNIPLIRATDWGTWRRVVLVPFTHIFKDEEKDINMPQKLAAEMPQILGWMIQGNVKLLKEDNGQLVIPKCIEENNAQHKKDMNVINAYLSQRCQDFKGYRTKASALFDDYKKWALQNNEYLFSETRFGKEMGKKGYEKIKTREGIFYIGIKLYSDTRGHIFGESEDDE